MGLVEDLLEKIKEILERIKEKIAELLGAILEKIRELIWAVIDRVYTTLQGILDGLRSWLEGVIRSIEYWASTIYNAIHNVVSKAVDYILSGLSSLRDRIVETVTSIGERIYNKLADIVYWVLTLPSRIREAIESLYYGIYTRLDTIINVFGERIAWLGSRLEQAISTVRDTIEKTVRAIVDPIVQAIEAVKTPILQALGGILDRLESLKTSILDAISTIPRAIQALGESLYRMLENIPRAIESLRESIANILQSLPGIIAEAVRRALGDLVDRLERVISTVNSGIRDLLDRLASTIQGIISNMTSAISTMLSRLESTITSIGRTIEGSVSRLREVIDSSIAMIGDRIAYASRRLGEILERVSYVIGEVERGISQLASTVEGAVTQARELVETASKAIPPTVKDAVTKLAEYTNPEKFKSGMSSLVDMVSEKVEEKVVREIRTRLAITSIEPEFFVTPEFREEWRKLKQEWMSSPTSIQEIIERIMDIIRGRMAKIQMERISGIRITDRMRVTMGLFNEIGYLTDLNLLLALVHVIAEVSSLGQVDTIIQAIDTVLRNSGVTQVTGYGLGMLISEILSPFIIQEINRENPITPPSPSALIELKYRGEISEETYEKWMLAHGYGEEQRKILEKAYEKIPPPSTLVELYFRGRITKEEYEKYMKAHGITPEVRRLLEEAYWYQPTPSDLISWIAKEVFEPESIKKYGLLEEFEKLDLEEFKKTGIRPEHVKYFWIAHWQHPSFTQMVEMYRRGLVTYQEFWDWFRLVEIPPYWRDKMIQMTYEPLTRVDLRHIYIMGGKSEEWLRKNLQKLGYFGEEQEDLVRYYNMLKMESDVKLSRSLILEAYEIGEIDRAQAMKLLEDLGYSEEEADIILGITEYQIARKERKEDVELLLELLRTGAITYEDFEKELEGMVMTERERKYWRTRAMKVTRRKVTLPSKEELLRWVKKGVITVEEFIGRMKELGYLERDISLYLKDLGLEVK